MTKSKKITIITSIIVSVLLVLILGTVFDLQISKAIADLPSGQYYTTNIFAIIFECFGEDVLYLLVISACSILFYYIVKNPLSKKWLNYLLLGIIAVVSYIVAVYLFYVTLDNLVPYTIGVDEYINSIVGKITILIFPIIIAGVIYLLVYKLKPETIKSLWKWALLVVIVAILSNAIVQIAKHIFDRTRFRAMVFSGDDNFTFYTNWFCINRNKFATNSIYANDFFKSFPSGHTCAAASVFVLTLLPYYIQNINTKRNKIILWIVTCIYVFLVALSRIVAGAHFFTDVYVSFLITSITILVTYIVINSISKKLEKNVATPNTISNNNEQVNKTVSDFTNQNSIIEEKQDKGNNINTKKNTTTVKNSSNKNKIG